jgi:RNA polymerase sigma-70 factor (ECF subfamily)
MMSRLARMFPHAVTHIFLNQEEELEPSPKHGLAPPGLVEFAGLHLLSDEDLMGRLQAGEHDALTILFKRHYRLVHRIARAILRSDSDGEDVVQEVFIGVFRAAAKYDRQKSTFRVWLLMYAYHRAIDKKRNLQAKRYYVTETLEETEIEACAECGERKSFSLRPAEASLLIEQVLMMVKPRERRAIELVHYQGLTLSEASARSGMSIKALQHCYYRGLNKLRGIISLPADIKEMAEERRDHDQPEIADARA